MEDEYKETIKGRIIYGISIFTRLLQNFFAEVFTVILIWPCVRIVRKEKPVPDGMRYIYQFDCSKRPQALLFQYWKMAAHFQMWISGLRGGSAAYKKLLNWDLGIPVMGFDRGKTTQTIEMLSPFRTCPVFGDTSQGWDVFWTTRPIASGKIKLLRRTISDSREIEMTGVWKSGAFAGKTFTISSRSGALPETVSEGDFRPTNIYVAPTLLIWTATLMPLMWGLASWAISHLLK